MEKLKELFNIKKSDVISITGSGGKTTLMFALANELKNYGKVLITTSTKIYIPSKSEVDYLYKSFSDYKKPKEDKILVCIGEEIKEKNKLSSIGIENLNKIKGDFDYIIIESDGSRNLPLKMWKDHEPVIYPMTTKTIGVFPVDIFGQEIKEDFIYNFQEFQMNIFEDIINEKVYSKLIDLGLFGDFFGEKYVLLNKVEKENLNNSKVIKNYIKENNKDIKSVILGSLRGGIYYEN